MNLATPSHSHRCRTVPASKRGRAARAGRAFGRASRTAPGVGDHISRSAQPPGRKAIPHRDQHLGAVDNDLAALHVGVLGAVGEVQALEVGRPCAQLVIAAPRGLVIEAVAVLSSPGRRRRASRPTPTRLTRRADRRPAQASSPHNAMLPSM